MARRITRSRGQLPVAHLRALNLKVGTEPGRPRYLSSASGLVLAGDELCVVADDELHLGRFALATGKPGRLQRLFAGDLPDGAKKRKKRKPDLEILLRLPPRATWPHGALLALGSGSGKHRRRGALLRLDARGRVAGKSLGLDAAPLIDGLAHEFADLNLEGGWVQGDVLHLLQRGNKGDSPNAVVSLALPPILRSIAQERVLREVDPVAIRERDLGDVAGVPLSFTDAAPLGDGSWLFSAVAEETADSRADGPCVGAAIGSVDARGRMRWIKAIEPCHKIEGICARPGSGAAHVLLVTDADDPAVPASLLLAEIP